MIGGQPSAARVRQGFDKLRLRQAQPETFAFLGFTFICGKSRQVDVGQQRRDRRPLPGSPVAHRHGPVFQDARLKPLPDQADDARVGPRDKILWGVAAAKMDTLLVDQNQESFP